MVELLKYILLAITRHPDDVRIEEKVDGINVTMNLYLNNEDKPLIIGKLGARIKAIRDVVAIIAIREGKKLYIKIMDE